MAEKSYLKWWYIRTCVYAYMINFRQFQYQIMLWNKKIILTFAPTNKVIELRNSSPTSGCWFLPPPKRRKPWNTFLRVSVPPSNKDASFLLLCRGPLWNASRLFVTNVITLIANIITLIANVYAHYYEGNFRKRSETALFRTKKVRMITCTTRTPKVS